MQGLTIAAITTTEKHTFNARLDVKSRQSYSCVKSRSRAPGHSTHLKSMLRKITMQGMTLASMTASEKHTLMLDSTSNNDKATEV